MYLNKINFPWLRSSIFRLWFVLDLLILFKTEFLYISIIVVAFPGNLQLIIILCNGIYKIISNIYIKVCKSLNGSNSVCVHKWKTKIEYV